MTRTDRTERTWDVVATDPMVVDAVRDAAVLERIVTVPECRSTQDVAMALASEGAVSGTVVVAGVQTAGRGRTGRAWEDDGSGGSLALSILLDVPDLGSGLVPHALGLAVLEAARALGVVTPRLKWPNDLIVRTDAGPRKLCGVLVERTDVGGRQILVGGIGVNVDHRHLPEHEDRTSLAALAGGDVDRAGLLAALVRGVDRTLVDARGPSGSLLARYREACDTIGRTVVIQRPGSEDLVGVAEAVDEQGRLIVRDEAGPHIIMSGTVRDAVRRR